jgi:hypothetical protein
MRSLLLGVVALFLTTSCMEIDGKLEVIEDLQFNNATVEAGNYRSTLQIDSRDKVTLEIKNGNKRDTEVEFRIPKDSGIPQDNGTFFYRANEVDQPYDLSGEVKTNITRSPRRYDRERCSYQDYETRCRRVCRRVCRDRPDGRRVCRDRCQRQCRRVRVTKWGWRDIEYHNRTEDKDYTVEFLQPNSNMQAAMFDGNYTRTTRIINYRGRCDGRY